MGGAQLADRLGMPGDREWDEGSPTRPGSSAAQKFGGWAVDSRVDPEAAASAHLEDLLARTTHLAPVIDTLTWEGHIEPTRVWLHLDSPETGLSLEPSLLRRITELGSFEIDVYS
jgi:hypothetical protein